MTELRLEPLDDLAAARHEWSALAERAGNLFGTWEWADAWWRAFGGSRPLALTACRDQAGALVAILPLYLSARIPARVLRFIGHGPADQLGPVCAPEDRQATAAALMRLLDDDLRWHVLLAERLAPTEGWAGLLDAKVVHREESPVLEIGGRSFEEYLGSRSRNFREQVRRRSRKLARDHDVSFRLSDAQHLAEDMETLFLLHAARWSNDASDAFAGARRDFHLDFARRALERGWLRLWLLEVAGVPRAAWYGFRFADADWYYQSGRDPDWERESVGFVLLSHTIEQAFNDGMREYRLLRGGESYKSRFASDDPGLETAALGRGPLGRAALVAASMPRGAVRQLRRLAD